MNWLTISSAWGLASGLIIALLGLLVLFAGAVRPRGTFAFAAFALIWGVQIALFNAATIAPSVLVSERLYLYGQALLAVAPFMLSAFVLEQPLWPARRSVGYGVLALTALIGLAVVATMALRPEWLFQGINVVGSAHYPDWGPLNPLLVAAPSYGVLGYAFHVAAVSHAKAPTARTARAGEHFALGLGLIIAFTSGWYATFYAWRTSQAATLENLLFLGVFLVLAALVVYHAVRAFQQSRAIHGTANPQGARKLFWLLALPFGWGVVEVALTLGPVPGLQTLGAWRIIGVGFIVMGLQQWRIVAISHRTRKMIGNASGAVAAAAGGIIVTTAAAASTAQLPIIIASGVTVAALSWSPLAKLTARSMPHNGLLPARPNPKGVDENYGGRIEAYRAAVESSIAAQRLDDDHQFLNALRDRLGITNEEHRLILHMAKESVVAQRDGDGHFYAKLRLLGEGGMGRTWLVRDRRADRLAVIKEPLPHWQAEPAVRKAIQKEAKLAASVKHANVLRTEALLEAGTPVILMEYAEGGTLTDLLRSRGTLPWQESKALVLDVLSGLQAVHARGIVHRDLKPSNIFLDREGRAKIGDFGIARDVLHDKTQIMTQIGIGDASAVGTPSFMAPEVKRGGKADERSDVYAAAAVLYACLVGRPPEPARMIPNGVPERAHVLLEKGLTDDPESRFQSAREFAHRLQAT